MYSINTLILIVFIRWYSGSFYNKFYIIVMGAWLLFWFISHILCKYLKLFLNNKYIHIENIKNINHSQCKRCLNDICILKEDNKYSIRVTDRDISLSSSIVIKSSMDFIESNYIYGFLFLENSTYHYIIINDNDEIIFMNTALIDKINKPKIIGKNIFAMGIFENCNSIDELLSCARYNMFVRTLMLGSYPQLFFCQFNFFKSVNRKLCILQLSFSLKDIERFYIRDVIDKLSPLFILDLYLNVIFCNDIFVKDLGILNYKSAYDFIDDKYIRQVELVSSRFESSPNVINVKFIGIEENYRLRCTTIIFNNKKSLLYEVIDVTEIHFNEMQIIKLQRHQAMIEPMVWSIHHVKNIICVITGILERLKKEFNYNTKSLSYINNLVQSSNDALKDLSRLLMWFKNDKNGSIQDKVLFQGNNTYISQVLTSIDYLSYVMEPFGIYLKMLCAPHIPPIGISSYLLEQLLVNLISNAKDAIGDNPGFILLYSEMVKEKNISYVKIMCSDTGSGINDEICDKVFDANFTTKSTGGFGVGLYSIKKIVENTGGYIHIKNKNIEHPKQFSGEDIKLSTQFNIYIPVTEIRYKNIPKIKKKTNNYKSESNWDIFVLDDNKELQKSIVSTLQSIGFNVKEIYETSSPEDILNKSNRKNILLICDIHLCGGKNGIKYFQDVKDYFQKNNINKNLKVILMSGDISNISDYNGKNYIFIEKPFSIADELCNTIKSICDE